MSSTPLMQMVILIPAVLVAAVFDWRDRRIPNPLCLGLALAGLVGGAYEFGVGHVWSGLASGVLGGLACMPMYVMRGLSAGDVKLIAATSVWWSISQLLIALAAIALCGAVLALGYLCVNRGVTHIPYAVAIAASTVATVMVS
jgi:prepilin peptidase CpaA